MTPDLHAPRLERPKIDAEAVRQLFDNSVGKDHFPPVLSPQQAAALLNISVHTLYQWLSKGYLKGCSRRRGKRVFIWRDALVVGLFRGPSWRARDEKT
jgi:excisionase family DNA binding protein